ncbi:MAG: dTDP-4-dehydrorhamnose 3,5-epimerase [Pseudomonadota bacterium]|nr:dTDP-4-dehydrorhamnose 3,5-epimerase [Pseudomonadota bacterium]
MIFTETKLDGAFLIDIEERTDERGFFARSWCQKEFEQHGLVPRVVQANISFNHKKGTVRGMHYQASPYEETKLVRCTRGAIYDVIVDLRKGSPTYCQWISAELTADNRRMLFVPEGYAHGFQTLTDATEVCYQVSQFYTPGAERGARFNDPAFSIRWPLEVTVISEKDANWADFQID